MSGSVTHDLVVTRIFDAPVERVWRAWSDPDQVKRWWGPQGFTAPVAQMDFRVGGRSLVCMRAPAEFGGGDIYTTWSYRRIDPSSLIEFILNFSDAQGNEQDPAAAGIPPGVPPDVRHVITFKPLADGTTEMSVAEYGYLSPEARDMSKAGLDQTLDKMAASFAGPATSSGR